MACTVDGMQRLFEHNCWMLCCCVLPFCCVTIDEKENYFLEPQLQQLLLLLLLLLTMLWLATKAIQIALTQISFLSSDLSK
jgi:hypothetical protein